LAVAALLVALVAMSVVLPAAAQAPRPMKFAGNNSEGRGTPVLTAEEAAQTAARTPDGRVKVVVTLATAPAVESFVAAGGRENRASAEVAAAAAVDAVRAEQISFESAARSIGADVVASTQYVLNSVTVAVAPEAISSLYQIVGVLAVSPVRIYEREHTTSVPLVRAPSVWDSTFAGGGFTGDGITIAVIDDGIDYTHLHFGGEGGYATNDPTILDYPNWPPAVVPAAVGDQKVIGGTDLVGDDYDAAAPAGDPTLIPSPDPDPGGCSNNDGYTGHGTHVAGSAAGWGVVPTGPSTYATFSGNYGAGEATLYPELPGGDVTNWHIGPGVAPEAYLVAIRVFGCSGSTGTDVLLDAIEMAVATNYLGETVDVINMSLGSAFGGTSTDDPLIVAQENAADAGVSVVTSAGNSGNFTLVSGAPGSSPSSISVANITDGSAISDAEVELTSGAGSPATFAAVNSAFGLEDFTNFTDELIVATPADGCTTLTGGPYTGKTVIIDRGVCEFSQKANRATAAGATGVIVVNNNAAAPFTMGNGTVEPATTASTQIPAVMVSLADGALLKAAAAGANTISMSSGVVSVVADAPSRIVSSSSRGGTHRGGDDLIFKPNVAAPGDTIASAGAGTDWDMNVIGGTSMASPHVAGVVALLTEQLSETVSPDRVKALIMNTANPGVVLAGLPATTVQPPQRVGAGQVDVYNAALAKTFAYATDAPESVAVSFGYPKVLAGTVLTVDKTITLNNPTGAAVTYNVGLVQRSDMAGTSFGVAPSTVVVPANGTATVTVTLTSDPNQPGINVATYAFDSGAGATFLTEESALVSFTGATDGTPDLVVPVYAAPHVAADMTATGLSYQTTFDAYSIDLNGTEIDTNGADGVLTNISSMVSALELVATDPDEAPVAYIPRPGDNFLQENNEGADIAAIGVTSDALSTSPFAGTVYFGVATHGEWTTPKEVLFLFNIDTNQDGAVDFQIYNSASVSNAFQSVFADINDFFGGGSDAAYTDWYLNDYNGSTIDTMLFKNNVVTIPFSFSFWNQYLPAGLEVDGAFDFWVETYNRDSDFELVIDTVGSAAAPFTYNPFAPAYYFLDATGQTGPALSAYGAPLWWSQDGYGIPVDIVESFGAGETRPDILVLHHHNQFAADRYQVLDTEALEPVEDGFELLTPANNAVIVDPSTITTVTWEDRTNVTLTEWHFVLTQISTNTRLGQVIDLPGLTSVADADELTCDGTVCTLDASGLPALEDGLYSWTATYTDLLGAEIEAVNAPFFFTVETNDINVLANPGFEECVATEPTSWSGKAPCRTKAAKANSGNGFVVAKAGKYAVQKVFSTASAALDAQTTGDVLNFGGYFKGGAAAKKVFVLTVRYPAGTADQKEKLLLTTNTGAYQLLSGSVTLTGDPLWVKVKAGSPFAKVFIDDLFVSTAGLNGPETRAADGLLPPPAAPDGFRGNN
jgi:subtilisin family serine protease